MSLTESAFNDFAPTEHCVNCGAPLAGPYCAQCGEHRVEAKDLRLDSFLKRTFHNVTNIDASVPRSLRLLVTRPGFLTAEYVQGRRKRYLPPLELFLLVNLLYFLVQSVVPNSAFTTSLDVHLHSTAHRAIAQHLVRQRLRQLTPRGANISEQLVIQHDYAARFDANTRGQAKSLVILMVPAFALVMALLYARSRRPAVQHIVFSLHFHAWFLALMIALIVVLGTVFSILRLVNILFRQRFTGAGLDSDLSMSTFLNVATAIYIYRALRTAYHDTRTAAALRTIGAVAGVTFALFFYRMILFFTVFYSTR